MDAINYIWVGPKKTDNWHNPEQDLIGIIKMIDHKKI